MQQLSTLDTQHLSASLPAGTVSQPANRASPARVRTIDAAAHVGQRIRLAGWVHRLRQIGAINFLVLRDGFGLFQAVLSGEALAPLAGYGEGSVVELVGVAVAEPQAPGGVELHDVTLTVISGVSVQPPFEINKKDVKAGLATFLDHAVVGLRHPNKRAIFRLSAAVMAGFRATLTAQGFTEVQTPKLVASATESGANVFKVDYFGRPAYLAQSPQFYKQTMVGIFERVFEVGPVFRAEPHDTTRHINEYVSLDVEFGFIQDHFDVMALLGTVLRGILAQLEASCAAELAQLKVRWPMFADAVDRPIAQGGFVAGIPWVYFPTAQELIFQATGEDCRGEPDLAPAHERWLGQWALQQFGSDFLFVTGYPMGKRPFYTHPNPADPSFSNSFDLLFRGAELVTGGQRRHRYDDYLAALAAHGVSDLGPFEAYLEVFKYGMPPHGGFAIGQERFLMQLLELDNIRLATLFPRDLNRLTP